jgi:hypothetical protein
MPLRPALVGLALLAASPSHAAEVDLGVDGDVAFALGDTFDGPGFGGTLHLGVGPNPIALGPSALSILVEGAGSWWRFPKADEPDVDLIRTTAGARFVFTPVWLRKPADEGGRGRGIRLDLPLALHAGVGTLDQGTSWRPTADASLGVAVGFLPLEVGVRVGVGAIAASSDPSLDDPSGTGWVNLGVDLGVLF